MFCLLSGYALLNFTEQKNKPEKVKFAKAGTFPLTSLTSFPGSGNTWVRLELDGYFVNYESKVYD